jgi:hypothetical protein
MLIRMRAPDNKVSYLKGVQGMDASKAGSCASSAKRSLLFKIDKAAHENPEIRLQAKAALEKIDRAIDVLLHHPLFDYLAQCARIGFTPQQFCIHGRGYLEACRQVIPLFEKAAARAKEQGDKISLDILNQNLDEEYGRLPSGEQDEGKVHTNLARQSHHVHAQRVFGVDPQHFEATAITPAVMSYIERQLELYSDPSYFAVISACYVDEKGATGMMAVYFKTLFEPYANHYPSRQAFDDVAEYWRAHLNELEAVHAKDIRRALVANCTTTDHVKAMTQGSESLLAAQHKLLDGVWVALTEAEKTGVPVATGSCVDMQVSELV